jgi:phage-related protein
MGYFIFKGRSSAEFGPVERTPMLIRNKQTLNITNIPYGTPVISKGGMETGTISLIIGIKDLTDTAKVDDLLGWLSDEGPLIMSTDTSKYMWAYCNAEIIPSPKSRRLATVSVKFVTEPYRYAVNNPETQLQLAVKGDNPDLREVYINNPGNTSAEPRLRLVGSGNTKLWLNHRELDIGNISGGAIVDIQTLRVKDSYGNIILNRTIGDPTKFLLNPGENYFEVTKNISEAFITMNTRWL